MGSLQKITFREATDADSDFVYALKKAALSHYVEKQYGDWNEVEQQNYHRERFAPQAIKIIAIDHNAVGYVSVVNESNYVKVNQLMIQPKHQGKGIGAHCMALIRREARRTGNPVCLQVMKVNTRAMNFYQRIGFIVTAETETHYRMQSS